MKKIACVSPGWLWALCLTGLALLAFPAAVAADSPVQNVPVPVSRWMVLNPATDKLYLDSYAGGSFLTVLNGTTYVTKTLAYPGGWFVDAAVDPIHNRIYILPGSYLSNDPILVVNGATDTWTTNLPIPTNTSRRENKALAVDAQGRQVYFAEETTGSRVLVHQIDAVTRATVESMDVTAGNVVDLAYNPVNGMVYLLTSHFVSGAWDHNTVWVLNLTADDVLLDEDIDVRYAKLVVNTTTGDVYAGRAALDGDGHIVLSRSLPAQARVVNPYTNKLYCFNNGGTLYEVDGARFTNRALRDFANIAPTTQGDAMAINPALNKLYLFSDQYGSSYVYDPTRDLRQTLPEGMTRWAAVNPHNHRLYLAPSRTQVSIYGGAPTLNVSPATLNFVALQDGDDPPAQGFIVRMNSSDAGNLRYTVASDAPWLAANKTGRFLEWYPVSTTLEAQVQVSIDITDLPASATPYVGHLTIASEGAQSSPRTVAVSLIVGDGASPLMQVDAANPARFEVMAGEPAPDPHIVNVRNLGAGSLTFTVTETVPWLDVVGTNPGSVRASALQSVTLAINSAFAALEPGMYSAPVTITGDSLGSPQTVNVELLIYPRPSLALSTRTLPFNAFVEAGDPALQYLFVTNDGGGLLDWTATPETAWLQTVGTLNGSAPGAFQVGADIATLDLGMYYGQITVAGDSPDVENSPQTVDVPLKVDTARRMALSKLRLDDFAFVEGATPDAQRFTIYNAGAGGAFAWQAETDTSWLTLSATSGTADESGTTVQVSVNPAELSVGEHHAAITVRGDRVKGAVQTLRVAVFVASASAPACLPGAHVDVVKSSLAKIAVDIAGVDAYHGAACDVTAEVTLDVYGFRRTYQTQGSISDTNALLLPIAETLKLTLAKVGLHLSSVQIGNDALTAQGQWDFGSLLGQTRSAGLVRIGRNGITFDGATVFPINQSWSFQGFAFTAEQGELRAAQSFNDFIMEVDGELTVKIYGSASVKLDVMLEVSRNGIRAKGGAGEIPLPNFKFSLAGFTVQTRDARFINNKVEIARAEIKTPANWGGLGTDLYNVTINGAGKVSVGGGEFRLPAIKAGGLNLMSLEGALREVTAGYAINDALGPAAAGYEIQAQGEFGVPGMGGSGACSIMIDVTVYVNSMGATVLELAPVESPASVGPPATNAINGFGLRQATVGLHCLPGVPLGNTGFFITGVQGSITLYDRVESVSLKMWIEHGTRIGSASLVSTDPQLTLYFAPFAIDFNAGIRVLNVKVAETGVHVDKNNFRTHISYNFLIIHGHTSFAAGSYNGRAYIAGSGKTSIGIKKGSIGKICIIKCLKLPPKTLNLGSIGIDFGTFRNGRFGVKGTIKVWKWKGGVYVGFDGKIKFGKLKDYQLVGSQHVRQARAAYALVEQGLMPQFPFNSDLSFAPNGDTLVRVTIPEIAGAESANPEHRLATLAPLFPTDVISTVSVLRGDVIFALAQDPDGDLEFTLVDPTGTTYTPNTLPSYAEYVQVVSDEDIQSMYFVENAWTGEWEIRITGDTDNTEFTVGAIGNTPPPGVLAVIQAAGPAAAEVAWIAQVATAEDNPTATLYAHTGPLTRTVTFTDTEGMPVTETEDVFGGIMIAEGLTTTTGTVAYSQIVDLGMLPSAVYAFWIEVDDGENPRLRWYIRDVFGTNELMTITVDHSTTFPVNWTATLTPTLNGIQSGDLDVAWVADAHPDALTYTLHVATPGTLTPTLLTTRVFTVSDAVYGSVETVRVDNVLPGQPYTFTLAAHNWQDGRVAWSQPVTLLTPQPDFIIMPTAPVTMAAGHTTALTLTLLIPDNLPFPVALAPGYIAAPDGFTLDFTPSLITTTGTVEAIVNLAAVPQMFTGTYAMPVIAQSGALVRGAVLEVTVVEANYPVYLPLVLR